MNRTRDLLAAEDEGWQRIHALFERVTRWDEPVFDDWTAKDLLAHIACWHAEAESMLEGLTENGSLPAWPDVDAFNADARAKCSEMDLHAVQAMAAAARHRFREEAARLPDEVGDDVARVLVGNGANHYAEHLDDLTTFVEGINA